MKAKNIIFLLFTLFSQLSFAQKIEQFAGNYFDRESGVEIVVSKEGVLKARGSDQEPFQEFGTLKESSEGKIHLTPTAFLTKEMGIPSDTLMAEVRLNRENQIILLALMEGLGFQDLKLERKNEETKDLGKEVIGSWELIRVDKFYNGKLWESTQAKDIPETYKTETLSQNKYKEYTSENLKNVEFLPQGKCRINNYFDTIYSTESVTRSIFIRKMSDYNYPKDLLGYRYDVELGSSEDELCLVHKETVYGSAREKEFTIREFFKRSDSRKTKND